MTQPVPPAGSFFDLAADLAHAQWAAERKPRIFDGLDLAVMAQVAVCEIPEITKRFTVGLDSALDGIARIDGPTPRRTRGDALLADTIGLRVVRGGMAA